MKYLLDFKNDTSDADIQQYCTDHNITVIKQFNKLGLVYEVSADGEPPITAIIEYVINDEHAPISLLSRDTVSFDSATDTNWWKMATLDLHDYDTPVVTHRVNTKNMNVYIVDSGITASHPEFVGVPVENIYSYDGTFDDINGHGTAIASIISGNTCSVSNADLKIVKIFGATPTLQSHLLAAFDAIIAHAATTPFPSIVNLSWIIDKNQFIESKIQKLIDNNIAVVCSAGNSGTPIPDVTPASMFDVITVGAYGQDFEPCDFSNYTGSGITNTSSAVNHGAIDMWSPGIDILAANIDGSYHIVSGTSIATAIHSATLAFVFGIEFSGSNPEFVLATNRIQNLISMPINQKVAGSYRKNVLTLEGVYAESVNRMSTILSKPEVTNRYAFDLTTSKIVNEPICEFLFLQMYITNCTVDKPLPTGLQIVDGHLTGTVDPAYLEGSTYKSFKAQCELQTVTGDTTSLEINLLLKLSEEIDLDPVDDPEIIVFLQSGPGCPNTFICPENPCTGPVYKLTQCNDPSINGQCNCF